MEETTKPKQTRREQLREVAERFLAKGVDCSGMARGAACRLLDWLDGKHDNVESAKWATEFLEDGVIG